MNVFIEKMYFFWSSVQSGKNGEERFNPVLFPALEALLLHLGTQVYGHVVPQVGLPDGIINQLYKDYKIQLG